MGVKEDYISNVKPALQTVLTAKFPTATPRNLAIKEIALGFGYQETLPSGPNPQSHTDFIIERMFMNLVQAYHSGSAQLKAQTADLAGKKLD